MANNIKSKKIKPSTIALIFTLILFSWILFEVIIKGFSVVQSSYGINPALFLEILLAAEIFFDLGIALIIIGSGVVKFSLKTLFKFDLQNVSFDNGMVYFGFSMNRIAALVPPGYLLLAGWGKMPWYITVLVLVELVIVFYIASIPFNKGKN